MSVAREVPADIVAAALRVAERTAADAADVPMVAIADEAGISRSTLIRRLGGTRHALDEAIRAAGVDPGGRAPVRDRAVQAAAELISAQGLGTATLEAIAGRAECSVHSLYAVFGGRDALLAAMFDRYTPVLDVGAVVDAADGDLRATVGRIYRLATEAFTREPRVLPAMLAEAISRPGDASRSLFALAAPRMLAVIGPWLTAEVAAGRIQDLPIPVLFQQMIAPIAMHTMLRPTLETVPAIELPPLAECAEMFADAFVKAVGAQPINEGKQP